MTTYNDELILDHKIALPYDTYADSNLEGIKFNLNLHFNAFV